jgi:hypothetical protein
VGKAINILPEIINAILCNQEPCGMGVSAERIEMMPAFNKRVKKMEVFNRARRTLA